MAQFKADAGTNRIAIACKIASLMPVAPTFYANGWLEHEIGFGEDESTDLDHPSYRLAEAELIARLGMPDCRHTVETAGQFDYLFWRAGRDRQHDECGLYIQCYNKFVVGAYVAKTNTVQSIVTHTTLTNSIVVKTNYIQ